MVFSSQVWAGCKQASAEEADLKKWSCSYSAITADCTVLPRNQALAVIVWGWTILVQ